jgi:outer membrane protein OmpA-like peptidoglycan-associated protein
MRRTNARFKGGGNDRSCSARRHGGGIFLLSLLRRFAHAADVPGGKDPAGFKRYEGSQIIHHAESRYAEHLLDRDGGWGKTETTEGEIGRVVYLVPEGPTALEVLRNYEQMLTEAGFQQSFELKSEAVSVITSYFCEHFFFGFEKREANAPYKYCGGAVNPHYATYKGAKDGKDVTVAVLIGESAAMDWAEPGVKTPIAVKKGQAIAAIDVITGKAVENKMVLVKAADIADALASKGSIDLYGIFFDVDKTDIKPDSTKTLDEVASLLKIDRSLKLEISGHTDNTGTAEHNLKLSDGPARAVSTPSSRTTASTRCVSEAKGYGDTKPVSPNDTDDGRAKNRRVELKKI